MTERQAQSLFAGLLGQLIVWIYQNGWELTFADFYRPDRQGHMANSLHYERLAADMNLFVNGEWKDSDCVEWQQIGGYWEAMNPLCRWGGRFPKADENHFSIEWEGRA